MSITYRTALMSDLEAVVALLKQYDLPSSDVAEHLTQFILAHEKDQVIGVGGYELSGRYGLIRSFAVNPNYAGLGIAGHIFNQLKEQAIQTNLTHFYLLTTTADGYFARLGFQVVARDEVPESIRTTEQFSSLCPGSATVMTMSLN